VTCSAGNHAQGVALSANKLRIHATIVMPLATPGIKVNAVRRFGGEFVKVLLHGENYDEASNEAKRLVVEKGLTMVKSKCINFFFFLIYFLYFAHLILYILGSSFRRS